MKWALGLAVAYVVGYLSWPFLYPTYSHRYRLVLEVKVDGVVRTGSSVMEASAINQPSFGLSQTTTRKHFKGEAVVVEVRKGQFLFAALAHGPAGRRTDSFAELALRAYDIPFSPHFGDFIALKSAVGRRVLSLDLVPTLVTFSDVKNPATVQVVNPLALHAAFGNGVELGNVWLELTNDPVTRNIETYLPWITEYKRRGRGDYLTTSPDRFIPGVPHFSRG